MTCHPLWTSIHLASYVSMLCCLGQLTIPASCSQPPAGRCLTHTPVLALIKLAASASRCRRLLLPPPPAAAVHMMCTGKDPYHDQTPAMIILSKVGGWMHVWVCK
jgi:hypothetical protein